MDNEIDEIIQSVLKIDVEGFEYQVLKGAKKLLQKQSLIAMIIETNELSNNYEISRSDISNYLAKYNYYPVLYDPFNRQIKAKKNNVFSKNTIYIKNFEEINFLIQNSKKYKILNNNI